MSACYYMSDFGVHALNVSPKGFSTWAQMLGAIKRGYESGHDLATVSITPKMFGNLYGAKYMAKKSKPMKKPGKGKGCVDGGSSI